MGLIRRAKLVLAVILVQLRYAGLSIISMFALKKGMSPSTFIVYRMAIATIVLAPFAFILERNRAGPEGCHVRQPSQATSSRGPPICLLSHTNLMTDPGEEFKTSDDLVSITAKIMLLSLFDPVLDHNLYYMGMKNSSATFTSAMFEKVSLKKLHSIAKVMGTVITVGGAIVLTLVRGPSLCLPWANEEEINPHQSAQYYSGQRDPVKGALFISGACFCWSWFVILQAIILRSYPCQLSLTAMICFWGMVEGAILAFVFERGHSGVWSIQFNIKLVAAIFYGVGNPKSFNCMFK
ncbi:hypothetical protein RchiOBHm_Chr7g0232741 [Rosa chinensis]|uniref:WAT1-related protein n=1 Tax=Rosa chinensis TaxID=74649 RepID=A0A2P6PFZ7_ROSCH|nr:hypothetical protein RchiOBHm_Chr7g0232741 [Rosa chinensis]